MFLRHIDIYLIIYIILSYVSYYIVLCYALPSCHYQSCACQYLMWITKKQMFSSYTYDLHTQLRCVHSELVIYA